MMRHVLAVFGNPIEHSRSPEIHTLFGEQAGIQVDYTRVLVPPGQFDDVASDFMQKGTGFNVTVPCKQDAWQWVDRATDRANMAEAVNTVWRNEEGVIHGDTTDGRGLVRDIVQNVGWQIEGRRVLVIGAGGAVSGVLGDLLDCGPASLHLYNRTHDKAVRLADRYAGVQCVTGETMESGYDLVINGTSADLNGETIDLSHRAIGRTSCVYDMMYSRGKTSFNKWCESIVDCETHDGLGMLVEQAAVAFETWFNVKVNTASVIDAMQGK